MAGVPRTSEDWTWQGAKVHVTTTRKILMSESQAYMSQRVPMTDLQYVCLFSPQLQSVSHDPRILDIVRCFETFSANGLSNFVAEVSVSSHCHRGGSNGSKVLS